MHVELQDAEDLRQKLLLMQIVKLEGGVHSVDHGVLVNKPWELLHDGGDQRSGVAEVVHDVAARNDMVVSVQAVVESSYAVDVVDLVEEVRFTVSSSALASVESGHSFIELEEGSFFETVGSLGGVFLEGGGDESGSSLKSTLLEEHRTTSSELRGGDSSTSGLVTELPGFVLGGEGGLGSGASDSVSVRELVEELIPCATRETISSFVSLERVGDVSSLSLESTSLPDLGSTFFELLQGDLTTFGMITSLEGLCGKTDFSLSTFLEHSICIRSFLIFNLFVLLRK